MNFKAISGNYSEAAVQAIVAPIFKDEKADSGVISELNELCGGQISAALESEEFKGKEGETLYLPANGNAKRVLLVGVGDQAEYKAPNVGVLAGTAARFLRAKSVKSFAVLTRSAGDAVNSAAAASQGVVTSLFELDKYRTSDKEERKFDEVVIVGGDGANQADLDAGVVRGVSIGESMNFTRDLANEPANVLTPTEMANRAKAMSTEVGLTCTILEEAEMEKLGMGSLMSVSYGSEQPAKLIVMKYEPAANSTAKGNELLSFVGKGITFDTGGISLKPAEGMDAMKYDKSGGATVIGTMRAIGLLKPSIPVLGIVAAVENMPDGKATRPGDVVTAMNGKTIEILNTDAEGRLILADAVAYAESQGATRIVDMATLTGAVLIALGDVNTGILGTSQKLVDEIVDCGKEVGEKFWQLPIGKEYSAHIKSDIADIKNIGKGRKAGTIAGAVFIQEFVKDAEWAHLDIAGTAWNDEPKPHHSKGPSGVAVRTLLRLVDKSQ